MAVSPGELLDIVLYQSEDSQADVPDDDRKHTMPAFDLDSWIAHYCLELGSPQPLKSMYFMTHIFERTGCSAAWLAR